MTRSGIRCCRPGTEAVWIDESVTWVAYASHEATVAFGGTLATALGHDLDPAWLWPGW